MEEERGMARLLFFVCCLAAVAAQAVHPQSSIADILAGRSVAEKARPGNAVPGVAVSPQEAVQQQQQQEVRPVRTQTPLRQEVWRDMMAVTDESTAVDSKLAELDGAEMRCFDRTCRRFFVAQRAMLLLHSMARVEQYAARVNKYMKRCEQLTGDAQKDCLVVLQPAQFELRNHTLTQAASGSWIFATAPVAIAGMVVSSVLIVFAAVAIVLALRAAQVRIALVLLASGVLLFASFRFAEWGTQLGVFPLSSYYTLRVLPVLANAALAATLAVLAMFWGRAVHEELYPSRVLLVVSRVALIACTTIVSVYAFIMSFVAPNFEVADVSSVLFSALQCAMCIMLVVYSGFIVHNVRQALSGEKSRKSRTIASSSAALRNSVILLVLAVSLLCFFLAVLTTMSYAEATFDFIAEAQGWLIIFSLCMEGLIAAALLAVVVLSVWSPMRRDRAASEAKYDRSKMSAVEQSQLDEPLVPSRYTDY